jgi:hypothetical protein
MAVLANPITCAPEKEPSDSRVSVLADDDETYSFDLVEHGFLLSFAFVSPHPRPASEFGVHHAGKMPVIRLL